MFHVVLVFDHAVGQFSLSLLQADNIDQYQVVEFLHLSL